MTENLIPTRHSPFVSIISFFYQVRSARTIHTVEPKSQRKGDMRKGRKCVDWLHERRFVAWCLGRIGKYEWIKNTLIESVNNTEIIRSLRDFELATINE